MSVDHGLLEEEHIHLFFYNKGKGKGSCFDSHIYLESDIHASVKLVS